jgi:hypothetical protein
MASVGKKDVMTAQKTERFWRCGDREEFRVKEEE